MCETCSYSRIFHSAIKLLEQSANYGVSKQLVILYCIYIDSVVHAAQHGSVVANSMLTKPSQTYPFHANPAAFNRGIRP